MLSNIKRTVAIIMAGIIVAVSVSNSKPVLAATSTQSNDAGKVYYTYDTNTWSGGYIFNLSLTNKTLNFIEDWEITIPKEKVKIVSIWNAQIEVENDTYVITPVEYNSTIGVGTQISWGFLGEGRLQDDLNATASYKVGGKWYLASFDSNGYLVETPTVAPTTVAPTKAPTTVAPTTVAPTKAPTTVAPTKAPTTVAPTKAPTTVAPTVAPTTVTPSEITIIANTFVESLDLTNFSLWKSGSYDYYNGNYIKYPTRICLGGYVQFKNSSYIVSINNSDYQLFIRELDSQKNLISTASLGQNQKFTPKSNTMYIGIGIYNCTSESGMTYAKYKDLFNNNKLVVYFKPATQTTKAPTKAPTTVAPTKVATKAPTKAPTTVAPTKASTKVPTTVAPTKVATKVPTTVAPTKVATKAPTTAVATKTPTIVAVTKSPTIVAVTKAPTGVAPTKIATTSPATNNTSSSLKSVKITETCPSDLKQYKSSVTYGTTVSKTYYSTTCEKNRKINIVLPPGYTTAKKYPVMYVLHGVEQDENTLVPSATGLYGNMLNQGLAKEMIMVFPYVYASKTQDKFTGLDDANIAAYDNFINEFVNDVKPFIEKNFSVATGRKNTAMIGFSMGGKESLYIGIKRQDLIGYICSIAPGPGLVQSKESAYSKVGMLKNSDVKFSTYAPYLLMLCAGEKDKNVDNAPALYHNLFNTNGINHNWWIVPNANHGEEECWSGMYNFFKYAFK